MWAEAAAPPADVCSETEEEDEEVAEGQVWAEAAAPPADVCSETDEEEVEKVVMKQKES